MVFVACVLLSLTFLSLPLSNNDKLQHSLMTATIVVMSAALSKKKDCYHRSSSLLDLCRGGRFIVSPFAAF